MTIFKSFLCIFILSLFFAFSSHGQECSHQWATSLEINPEHPKKYSGDTYAAYGLFSFVTNPNVKFRIEGEFFKGRFMSFESYRTKQKLKYDALYDHEMQAAPGSENPFHVGVPLNTSRRSYVIEAIPKGAPTVEPNTIFFSKARVNTIMYRAYVPNHGITITHNDLPKIYALDVATHEPVACPPIVNTEYDPGLITLLLNFVKEDRVLEFKERSHWNALNHAVPRYVGAVNKVPHGNVAVMKFKAPTYVDTMTGQGSFSDDGETRYWSLCIQNFKESKTLNCLPDYLATPDSDGVVTLVVGGNESVKERALARGYNYLPDRRLADQEILGFVYRNLFPKQTFPYYEGDYMPTGVVMTPEEFHQSAF